MTIFHKFFCIISCIALVISFVGMIIVIKTLFYCIKRYVLSCNGVGTELSTLVFSQDSSKRELTPSELVRKATLKDKIDKFARETYNMVKSNNYLSERKEDVVDEDYKKEMETLSEVYISLDKMPINNSSQLDEVEFLFNSGKLRSDDEICEFYKTRELNKIQEDYRNAGFLKDILETYHESELSRKIILGLSLMFISSMYMIYKLCFAKYNEVGYNFRWSIKDVFLFIADVFSVAFDPYYEEYDYHSYINDGNHFFFCCSLLLSTMISFIIGGGFNLISSWSCNIKINKMYNNAGVKKKPDILLGVNTASYLYVLHKLLKKRK